jgi:hypothetical protein
MSTRNVPGNNATLLAVAARAIRSGADFHIGPRESQVLEAVLGLAIADGRASLLVNNLPTEMRAA